MRPPPFCPNAGVSAPDTGNADDGALSRCRTVAARGAQTHPRKEPWRLEDVRRIPGLPGLGKGLLGLGKKHGAAATQRATGEVVPIRSKRPR
jgi:hypothetical protein